MDEKLVGFSYNNRIFIEVLVNPLREDEAISIAKAELMNIVDDVEKLKFEYIRFK